MEESYEVITFGDKRYRAIKRTLWLQSSELQLQKNLLEFDGYDGSQEAYPNNEFARGKFDLANGEKLCVLGNDETVSTKISFRLHTQADMKAQTGGVLTKQNASVRLFYSHTRTGYEKEGWEIDLSVIPKVYEEVSNSLKLATSAELNVGIALNHIYEFDHGRPSDPPAIWHLMPDQYGAEPAFGILKHLSVSKILG